MKIWVFACAVLFSTSLHAGQSWFRGVDITKTLIDSSRFGQCMVRLADSVDIQSSLPLCKPKFVTFDCGAELPNSTRINSLIKFESAEMAHALSRKVTLLVTDSQTINGYCLATQIQVEDR